MQQRHLLLFLLSCFLVIINCSGKQYTRCGLAIDLASRNFPRSFLSNWVCLIESESGKDTSKVTQKADGSKSFGLFQINSKEWCQINKKGGKCNERCEDFTNDDITDDVICAKKIYSEKGFQAWPGWTRSCYGRKLYDVSKC